LCCDCDTVMPYPGAPDAIRSLRAIPQVEMICVTSNPGERRGSILASEEEVVAQIHPRT